VKLLTGDFYRQLFEGMSPRCAAFVGAGGKTTTIHALAGELAGAGAGVIITTTTKMHPPEDKSLLAGTAKEAAEILKSRHLAYAGVPCREQKMTGLPEFEFEKLLDVADCVLVEADGARKRPLKMTASYEPVVPARADYVVAMAGLDCVGGALKDVCHRPELAAEALKVDPEHRVEPRDVAELLRLCYVENPVVRKSKAGFAVLLNKADDARRLACAEEIASHLPGVRCLASMHRSKVV
jgi:probable selenium-dependent hydroxylase accessory protein YqeC